MTAARCVMLDSFRRFRDVEAEPCYARGTAKMERHELCLPRLCATGSTEER
jgi:hypothetical protein